MSLYALKFISGKYRGAEFPLPDDGELLIGRATDLDLVLVEDMVSRKHAKMVATDGTLNITDLGSTNGTFVNGEKVRRTDIQTNDRILIGTSILKVIDAADMSVNETDPKKLRAMMESIADGASEGTTMSGELEDVPLPDLLQLFATNKKSGVLTISGARRGKIYIKGGQLQHAIIGGEVTLKPMKAICRMVAWESGTFRMEEWSGGEAFPDEFQESTESILMDAMRQHDEIQKLMPEMPPPTANLTLCLPLVPKLSELDTEDLDTLQLVLNFNTFKSVIDKTPGTDHEAVTRIHKLLRAGYLETD